MGKYEARVEPKLFLVENWARDGLSDEQIAKNLGIAYSTLREYKKAHEALSAALEKGKEVVDYEVENALLKKALGYDYEETKTVVEEDSSGRVRERVETIIKHQPPDAFAATVWLNNRRPDRWRRNAGKENLDQERFEHQKKIDEKKNW